MEYKKTLQNILATFAQRIGHKPLTLDKQGYIRITIKERMEVRLTIDEEHEALQLIASIAPDNPEIYADLLELNRFRTQLAGARFILLREAESIALLKHIEIANLTLQEFEMLFEEFLNIAQKWSNTFSEEPLEDTDDSNNISSLIMNDIFNRA